MKKILLVEDDVVLSDMYLERLKVEGYDVQHAENGLKAIEIIPEFHPDLILLDIMMPEMDGMEVLHHLKSQKDTSEIPIFILTALSQSKDREEGLKAGANDYIVKSELMPKEIVEKIKKILG